MRGCYEEVADAETRSASLKATFEAVKTDLNSAQTRIAALEAKSAELPDPGVISMSYNPCGSTLPCVWPKSATQQMSNSVVINVSVKSRWFVKLYASYIYQWSGPSGNADRYVATIDGNPVAGFVKYDTASNPGFFEATGIVDLDIGSHSLRFEYTNSTTTDLKSYSEVYLSAWQVARLP